ncbi:sugar phosphate nucleotidyltransferase [Nocardioides sp. C4-1]|uniref:glucose-1-phosphate adenylyltransferase family protein n=1 Tax=Nocardioides sp. C4-1 TaxID=3151851 RepID=UPI0032661FDB
MTSRRPKVVAVVQAGGAGSRMDVLTRERAKPALPFAGVYQLLDFVLTNLAHSGIDDVWLSVQYHGASLEEQVANGRPWNLDRTGGGLRLLMPEPGTGSLDEEGFATGNADGLFRIRDRIRTSGADVVVVASADHVYRLDLADVVATHQDAGAECTVVVTDVDLDDASEHAVVEVGDDGRVTGFDYKPDDPEGGTVSTEVFAYDPAVLVEVLEELHRELGAEAPDGDSGLGDFGEHLLPRLVGRGRVVAHRQPGYWRDLGRPSRYLKAHLDVIDDDLGVLDVDGWPMLTQQPQRRAARLEQGAELDDALVSNGATVAGRVVRSVIGPGAVVEAGAEVVESVVFADVVVERGAQVRRTIVDTGCVVGRDAVVGDLEHDLDDDHVTLLGRDVTVGAGVVLPAGARVEPGGTA